MAVFQGTAVESAHDVRFSADSPLGGDRTTTPGTTTTLNPYLGLVVLRGNCPTNRGNCLRGSCPIGIMVLGGSCLGGYLPSGLLSYGGNCPMG